MFCLGFENIDPLTNLYKEFLKILNNITIKYSSEAEKYETYVSKYYADAYIDSYNKTDTFYTYSDYTDAELDAVGVKDYALRKAIIEADYTVRVPKQIQEALLLNRRQSVLNDFEEQNDYYRMLTGYPPLHEDESKFHYLPEKIAEMYEIDKDIPIHQIQDYYNIVSGEGVGDSYIQAIEGLGVINRLRQAHPDETYLKYIGSNRISIVKARKAKNFEILRLDRVNIKANVYDAFIDLYANCREYFVTTIFNSQCRNFIDYYDNFIAMCIMIMTMQQLIMKQIPYAVNRNFFDVYGVQQLYLAYGIPYDLDIDEETQMSICQNLNLLINNKSTNKVIYDIGSILGFTNLKAYKYYLMKEHSYDIYGVPIFKYREQFNPDTGETETVPDVEAMYDMYFQKEELRETDFIKTFNDGSNKRDYEEITEGDPFWWEDQNLIDRKWDAEYNFVETKYLSLGLSYSMTGIMFENIILLKMLMNPNNDLGQILISVPKILDGLEVPIYDLIILLICLVAKKHHLTGEVIAVPTQIADVLDYFQNTEIGDSMCVDTFSFNFEYLLDPEGVENVNTIKKHLTESDAATLSSLLSTLSWNNINSQVTQADKLKAFNQIFTNITGLEHFIRAKLTDATDRVLYEELKKLYRMIYYSREMKSLFEITGQETGFTRTAMTYFEYLYYHNPKLYSAIFCFDSETEYEEYMKTSDVSYTYEEFMEKVESGEIALDYSKLNTDDMGGTAKITETTIYYYVNHIISRLKTVVDNINLLYMINDSQSALEDLLVNIIRWAKSFTVDMLGLDIIYVCDFKPENLLRFIDEIEYIQKLIEDHDYIYLSHSDVIRKLYSEYHLKDSIKFEDYANWIKWIIINSSNDNHIFAEKNDAVAKIEKLIQLITDDAKELEMTDYAHLEATLHSNDDRFLEDGVYKMWYSDPE